MTLSLGRSNEEPKRGNGLLIAVAVVVLLVLVAMAAASVQPNGEDDVIFSSPEAERAAEEIERLAGIAREASSDVEVALRDGQTEAAQKAASLAEDALEGAQDALEAVRGHINETEALAMQDAILEIAHTVNGIEQSMLP